MKKEELEQIAQETWNTIRDLFRISTTPYEYDEGLKYILAALQRVNEEGEKQRNILFESIYAIEAITALEVVRLENELANPQQQQPWNKK